jgi:hypothetical protein
LSHLDRRQEDSMLRTKAIAARLLIMVVAVLGGSVSRAEAITLREIVELTRAGLGDDILLALIEVDQRVFAIDPDTLKALKDAGVSTRVIVAIVKSGRTPAPPAEPMVEMVAPEPPPPQVVVVDRPVVHEVAVPFPVYVAVGSRSRVRHRQPPSVAPQTPLAPYEIPTVTPPRPERHKYPTHAEPVYWGWGGKLRPDAWQPAPTPSQKR